MASLFSFLRSTIFPSNAPSASAMASAKQLAQNLISENRVLVFSKTWCPYCTRSKSILSSAPYAVKDLKVIELNETENGDALQQALAELQGKPRVTVPQIYINQKSIGGCSELQALDGSGQLPDLLKVTVQA